MEDSTSVLKLYSYSEKLYYVQMYMQDIRNANVRGILTYVVVI